MAGESSSLKFMLHLCQSCSAIQSRGPSGSACFALSPLHSVVLLARVPTWPLKYAYLPAQVMKALRRDLWGSVHPDAPMRVVRFSSLEAFGELPRSSDNQTVLLSEKPDAKIVFISHRWLRPWHTREECEKNGHEWAGLLEIPDAFMPSS